MAASSKFDPNSGSPDRPLYVSGQRGSYPAALLDRSGSFRDCMDNPILSALPNMSRSSQSVTQGDVKNFFQCLRFDPKLVAVDHKVHRQTDLRRNITALGASQDDAPSTSSKGKLLPSPLVDDLKQFRGGVRESLNKARERSKMLGEALSTLQKCIPPTPSRKRSRLDASSNERSNVAVSSDRSVSGPSISKMGSQSHAITSGFDLEQQKPEERIKSSIPSKRTRTSMMDARPSALARPSVSGDKDREILRLANNVAVQGEERTLSVGVDGWEKSKVKKKRSVIKSDTTPVTLSNKPLEGYREPKHHLQQRPVGDARSRLSDSHGFRSGVANGAVEVGKSDSISQQNGAAVRSSNSRTEQESSSLLNERRDRPGPDKDRMTAKASNKVNVREDYRSASPTSNMKANAPARAPRSGSSMVPKLSPPVHRTATPNDWELAQCSNKPPSVIGANNRKRTPLTRSSSPPVAPWASQRPQKIPRTARRTNLVPIASSNNEIPALDTISDVGANEHGLGPARRLSTSSPQQVKLKIENFCPANLSESEESAAADVKFKEKNKKPDEIDDKAGQSVQKVSTLILPSRKNKMVNGEDLGDNVRRQGRTGRGYTSTRSLMPMMGDKLSNVGTAKQLRTSRVGLDKTESKAGRPPSRKLSDRKIYTRQRHTPINVPTDLLVGSDNGHEELLAAAHAVINSNHASSSTFWRQMDCYFRFITDADIDYLKQQENLGSATSGPALSPRGMGDSLTVGFGEKEHLGLTEVASDLKRRKHLPEQFVSETKMDVVIPLCQRLIAALISEEENEGVCGIDSEYLDFDVYGSGYELDLELQSSSLNRQKSKNFCTGVSNGFMPSVNGASFHDMEHDDHENEMMNISNASPLLHSGHPRNGLLLDEALIPNMSLSEFQYNEMSISDRLLLEIQSIGIFPDLQPDEQLPEEEEISENISKLEDMYHRQVSKNKGLLNELLKSASETEEHQKKEFEHHALDKLVGMAYEKYMTCWGPNAPGGKNSSSKHAKQTSLAFVKRTLDRCREFEETGKSCFSDPLFRDMFLSGSSRPNDAQTVDTTAERESAKAYANISSHHIDARGSASVGSQRSPANTRLGQASDSHNVYSTDTLMSINHSSGQPIAKDDTWSNRVNKRELLLDRVGVAVGTSSSIPAGIGGSLTSSTKGKRSERDREGKGHREVVSRNLNTKNGRSAITNVKGERKAKSKPKQKTTQLSASVNGLIGKMSEPKTTLSSVPKSSEMVINSSTKEKDEYGLGVLNDSESTELGGLHLPEIDVLGDDLVDQGQDLGSWLNIDDDGFQDDIMGLEIPMDDLADLNMMV